MIAIIIVVVGLIIMAVVDAAMAFPAEYLVGGNKRDRVKQYGNAVTPPVMDWIVRQCAATLAPELEGGEAA